MPTKVLQLIFLKKTQEDKNCLDDLEGVAGSSTNWTNKFLRTGPIQN